VESERLGQHGVEGGATVVELLSQRLLGLGLVEQGTRHPGVTLLLL
jgi:hypothetical protein